MGDLGTGEGVLVSEASYPQMWAVIHVDGRVIHRTCAVLSLHSGYTTACWSRGRSGCEQRLADVDDVLAQVDVKVDLLGDAVVGVQHGGVVLAPKDPTDRGEW